MAMEAINAINVLENESNMLNPAQWPNNVRRPVLRGKSEIRVKTKISKQNRLIETVGHQTQGLSVIFRQ